jgi:squalene synthase HpnC
MKKQLSENGKLEIVYNETVKFAKSHYENFPVVSLFLPTDLRKYVAVIYRFARQADDIADEGIYSIDQRIGRLNIYTNELSESLQKKYKEPFWEIFYLTVNKFNLTPQLFYDLLSAFEQDIHKTRYDSYDELLDYCKRSANPVGRIVLEFFNIRDSKALEYSDAICTALQLTNFYQDVSVDWLKGRIYLPVSEMEKFFINETYFTEKKCDENFIRLIKLQIEKTYNLFKYGENLLPLLPRRLRFQIRLTILGGAEILKKIEKLNYDVLNCRPKFSIIDYIKLFFKAVYKNVG